MDIKKHFIPVLIVLGLICLNPIVVVLFDFIKPDLMEMFATTIVPIECVTFGLALIYGELMDRKKERTGYKVCSGVVKKSKFKLYNGSWLKAPVVSYVVDGKSYAVTSNIGINGIVSFFLKGKKIKVYYKEESPGVASFDNNIPLIVGLVIIAIGIFIFFYFNVFTIL